MNAKRKKNMSKAIAWAKTQSDLKVLAKSLNDLKENNPQGFIKAMERIVEEYEMSQGKPKQQPKQPKEEKNTYQSAMKELIVVQRNNQYTAQANAEIRSKKEFNGREVSVLERVYSNAFRTKNEAKLRVNEANAKIKSLKKANEALERMLKVYLNVEATGQTLSDSDAEAKAEIQQQVEQNRKELVVAEKIRQTHRSWLNRKLATLRVSLSSKFGSGGIPNMSTIENDVRRAFERQKRQRNGEMR